jgi:hypothetical protein
LYEIKSIKKPERSTLLSFSNAKCDVYTIKCHTANNPKLQNIIMLLKSTVSVNIKWHAFLGTVAKKISIDWSDICVTSLEWYWLKPASGPWLPVQDEKGFMSMIKRLNQNLSPMLSFVYKHQLRASHWCHWEMD